MNSYESIFSRLFSEYGPQSWWPADTAFEIMVGAILTQNTAWLNVERALANLKSAQLLCAEALLNTTAEELAPLLKPSGYFNVKAQRLLAFVEWYCAEGQYPTLKSIKTLELRKRLLSVKGVGPETADDILLYAFNRKVFVIDAYTRRIFSRLGHVEITTSYEVLRACFERHLAKQDVALFNEYHALIVKHGKDVCKTRPDCSCCCLDSCCPKQGVKEN